MQIDIVADAEGRIEAMEGFIRVRSAIPCLFARSVPGTSTA
jgi:hypothetical protein